MVGLLYRVIVLFASVGAGFYFLRWVYWLTVRLKARNAGIFRDDRRSNDLR
jgi:hypothetical protein